MQRTLIIQLETEDWATLEQAEEELLDMCNSIGNSYRGASCIAEICVEPISDALVSELCNTAVGRVER